MIKKVLVLASNPQGTEQLRLDKEIKTIQKALWDGTKREQFTVVPKVAVTTSELQSVVRREKPRIVHFCGHGTGKAGLVLHSDKDTEQLVSTQGIAELFKKYATQIECVVLNACYSKVQGEAINQHINYVIGTNKAIRDDAAIAFAKGFYGALGDGENIQSAMEAGCLQIQLDVYNSKNSDRKLVPIYSEIEEEYIELEEHKVLTLLTKEELNEILDIPDKKLSPHDFHSDQVSKGIYILADLIEITSIKTAVIKFKTEFQAISEQLEILGTYKDLHDLLHTLEFKCYKNILSQARNFPDDYDIISLELYGQDLQDIIADVGKIILLKNPAAEGITWHQDLNQALEFLQSAIEEEDKSQLDKAIWHINHVIGSEPSQINRALVSTAKVLRLPTLIEVMSIILDMIIDCKLESPKINQFQESVTYLNKLNDNLKNLAETHDKWQKIDFELRRIETLTANTSDLLDLEMSWSHVKAEVEEQYQDSQESWVIALKKEAKRLDEVIAAQNSPKVKRYFSSYRNRASRRFYEIDRELRNFCGNLREVGNPLAYLLRMLE
jgi:hypothetical protein